MVEWLKLSFQKVNHDFYRYIWDSIQRFELKNIMFYTLFEKIDLKVFGKIDSRDINISKCPLWKIIHALF